MRNILKKRWAKLVLLFSSLFLMVGLTAGACNSSESQQRKEQAAQSRAKDTLEKENLRKKLQLEEDKDRVGYITLLAGVSGKPFGYYVVKGKVSNSGSQVDPEDLIDCPYTSDSCQVIDGPQDDGTYGNGDDGVFFFTTDGTYVEFTGDYVYSTQPLPSAIKIPKLG